MNKKTYDLGQITKVLEKLFKAGFKTEKSISNIQLDDLAKITDIQGSDTLLIIELKRAIKTRKLIEFLSGEDNRKDGLKNEK